MKLPYRQGELFALPLGDGSSVEAQILACGHHTVDIAIASLAPVRATDRALVLERWKRTGFRATEERPLPSSVYWRGAAYIERFAATQLRGLHLLEPPLVVHGRAYKPQTPSAQSDDDLRALPDDLRALRLIGRNARMQAALLERFTSLQRLDVCGVVLDEPERLASLRRLRALRIARIDRFDLHAIRDVRATTLAFESIADLRHVDALLERDDLVQLELLDQWPCELDEVLPLTHLPALVRAEIDIGGRRKNAELYRRTNWAYPWPFALNAT